jgi:hypothetical protein
LAVLAAEIFQTQRPPSLPFKKWPKTAYKGLIISKNENWRH